MFLSEIGVSSGGLDRLIERSYDLLGLMSYLTAGQPEVRAWTIKKGTKAPQAAGKIHTDFERGFIRAEVVSFDVLMECGSMQAAKEKGAVRQYCFGDHCCCSYAGHLRCLLIYWLQLDETEFPSYRAD